MNNPLAESVVLSNVSNNAENFGADTVNIAVSLIESLGEFLEDEDVSMIYYYQNLHGVSCFCLFTHTYTCIYIIIMCFFTGLQQCFRYYQQPL